MQSKIFIDIDDFAGAVVRFSGVPSFDTAKDGEVHVLDKLVRRFLGNSNLYVREVVSSDDNSVQVLRPVDYHFVITHLDMMFGDLAKTDKELDSLHSALGVLTDFANKHFVKPV